MKIDRFHMERTQCLYENEVRFNLSESGVSPLTISELIPDNRRAGRACAKTSPAFTAAMITNA
jgi:hypothetical protein